MRTPDPFTTATLQNEPLVSIARTCLQTIAIECSYQKSDHGMMRRISLPIANTMRRRRRVIPTRIAYS